MICCESGLIARGGDGGARGVDRAGDGVSDRNDEIAVEFVLRGQGEDAERLEDLAEAFVVEEEEELVLDDGAAEVDAELVAVEGGLLEGDGVPVVPTRVGLKKPAALRSVLRMNS